MIRDRLVALVVVLLLASTCAAAAANLLYNPGFEAVDAEGAITGWWNPDYWSGELGSVSEAGLVREGRRAAALSARERQGRSWGRIHSRLIPVSVGLRYRVSAWARGSGSLKVGAIQYLRTPDGGTEHVYTWQDEPVALEDEWREARHEWVIAGAGARHIAVVIEVEGEGAEALLDEAAFTAVSGVSGTLGVEPGYIMAPVGGAVTITAGAQGEDGPLAGAEITVLRRSGDESEAQQARLDAEGRATLEVETSERPGLWEIAFASADLGAAETAYADVVDGETYEAFEHAAAEARLEPLPAHLLFVGDSLTDFSRGRNYVDQAVFWLRQVHGDGVSFRNAGVGGDMITRVSARLEGDPQVYRAQAYEGLFDPPPTHVFILLGHNDCKLTSGSDFTEPVVAPEQFRDLYRQVILRMREETGAQVTVISSTSSVYEITQATADRLVQAGRPASLFGRPEVMEEFNDLARAVAEETGAGYLDVYEPTRAHPDKPSLFTADGVHLSPEGNRLVALELLRHMAGR